MCHRHCKGGLFHLHFIILDHTMILSECLTVPAILFGSHFSTFLSRTNEDLFIIIFDVTSRRNKIKNFAISSKKHCEKLKYA